MIGRFTRALRNLGAMARSGRRPSARALAATAKLCGFRVERRWPFVFRPAADALNLGFDDLLEFELARSRDFSALVVGAFDGVANDPAARFIRSNASRSIFVEPQPGAFARLSQGLGSVKNIELLNAAVDQVSGARDIYCVPPGIPGLPPWTEQLASFSKEHLLKHEQMAPGVSAHIVSLRIPTVSFGDLLDQYDLKSLNLLQIDAEGIDAQLLSWFPFHRVKPGLLHYEIAHMSPLEHATTRAKLQTLGYVVLPSDCPTDDMAVLF